MPQPLGPQSDGGPSLETGRRRVVIENVRPQVDCGRFAIKRAVGERIVVTADAFADGHEAMLCVLEVRHLDQKCSTETPMDARLAAATDCEVVFERERWTETPMQALGNDRWQGEFEVARLGRYEYTLHAWIDHFHTWRDGLRKKSEAGQELDVDLQIGARLAAAAAKRAAGTERLELASAANVLESPGPQSERVGVALGDPLLALMNRYPDRLLGTRHPVLSVTVDPPLARASAWYEMFPRSTSPDAGRHGTFDDCIARLDYVQSLGFDIVYLPPVHPIGLAFRKGKNNAPVAQADDEGSPWAIGAAAGGHKAILAKLGTLADFRRLVAAAGEREMAIALDIAFQCSPDHPYVKEHPQWFRARPDGTIQYAENPPKKYQDIYPFDFETDDWQALWDELTSVVLYWCEQGVRVFRVDNPHTKPFAFWEFLIGRVKAQFPETIFLAEAFTRPKIMYRLGKLGFTQSYTYFTWRTGKSELTEYFTELTQTAVRETFRPNVWPNTPDILPEHLHAGNPAAFRLRFLLAATLSANYGIYGPAFELCEHVPREPKSEEYLDSEKYQQRTWNLDSPRSIAPLIAKVNRIRRENRALQGDWSLAFHPVDNEHLIAYSKYSDDGANVVLVVVNLDPDNSQRGLVELPLGQWGFDANRAFDVVDLLTDAHYRWQGPQAYVELHPESGPGHVFRIR